MSGLEMAAISLGTAVAKSACGIWLGDHKLAADTTEAVIETAAGRLRSAREQRQFRRLWEQAAEIVADQVEPLVAREFRGLPDNERIAALDAVRDTFTAAGLREADLFAQDLDAAYLDRYLRRAAPGRAHRAGLSAAATALYDLLLRECCAYAIEVARTLPQAEMTALAEVLRRETQLLDDLRAVLDRLPRRRGVADFERDYRQLAGNQLDRIEFFGATLSEASRRYPLSIAYLSLTASADFEVRSRRHDGFGGDQRDRYGRLDRYDRFGRPPVTAGSGSLRVEEVLGSSQRLFIRGQAGIGKTTLLQWIAVNSARGTFPERLTEWNGTIPFFIPLRRYAAGALPTPERFLAETGRHIAAEMPPGWVQQRLRGGDAVVLVDGVDELTEDRRADAQRWLRELVDAFPSARFVVTSRPAAVPGDWLGSADFDLAELEPMARADVPVFVHRWHEAMRDPCRTSDDRDELDRYEINLLTSLDRHRHLRTLAGYPLLCALLCALHRDRRSQLPATRMELYEVALHMLLERRDRERRLVAEPALSRTDTTLLLQDIAYWLLRNGWSTAPAERVIERIEAKLRGMVQVRATPAQVYRVLLERSGLLREPVEGQTDFVHRSFQEYLAAKEAVECDDIGALVGHADTDLWSEVVVMAAGHASASKRAELLGGLLRRLDEEESASARDALRLVAVASLESSPELAPELRERVRVAAAELLPPRTMAAARSLSKAGPFTLDLLMKSQPRTATQVAATIRAVAEIGDPAALPMLTRFGRDERKAVLKELLAAWRRFDPEEYARVVLADSPLYGGWLRIDDASLVPGLRHLANLRSLDCLAAADGVLDIDFVRHLPQLTTIDLPGIRSLEPLRDSRISCVVQFGDLDSPLSLAPLASVASLTELHIYGQPVTDLPSLSELAELRRLGLRNLGDASRLDALRPLVGLEDLIVGDLPDLESLRPLSFLAAPKILRFWGCGTLRDISELRRWRDSLTVLGLECAPDADLAPLADLCHLEALTMFTNADVDLTPVARMPKLGWLELRRPIDLTPLRAAPSLRTLSFGGSELDLTPLAGREELAMIVPADCVLHGAELLGPGSKIVRR